LQQFVVDELVGVVLAAAALRPIGNLQFEDVVDLWVEALAGAVPHR
jgi:hypothetical protein